MVPIDIPPELLKMSLPGLLEFLKLAAAGAAGSVSPGVIEWVKQRIKEEWALKKYGFTPDPETAASLKEITNSEAYNRMKDCIGHHSKYLDVIRLGLQIEHLSYNGGDKQIARLKSSVHKTYGREGIAILNIGNVGALIALINHMSQMKVEYEYSEEYLGQYFEEVIKNWKQISIFHQAGHGPEELVSKINLHMDRRIEMFFVFGIGVAGEQASKAIASMNNSKIMQKKGYMMKLMSKKTDIHGRDHFAWVFDLIDICSFDKITL
jgi:hypothetical protein